MLSSHEYYGLSRGSTNASFISTRAAIWHTFAAKPTESRSPPKSTPRLVSTTFRFPFRLLRASEEGIIVWSLTR